MKARLLIAVGSWPVLGDHALPLLVLLGRFDEALTPSTLAYLKARTDARLVFSPWSDHGLEGFDPVLVNAAVEAACAAVHKTPPPPPTSWRWRLLGAVLAMLAAGILAGCLMDLFPQLARFRGLLIGVFIAAAFMLTLSGRWIDTTPHLRSQGFAMPVAFLLVMIAGKLRIPRWSFVAFGVLVTVIALCWYTASPSWTAKVVLVSSLVLTPAAVAAVAIGWAAARRGSRLQGDIAMAIFLGCAPFQCIQLPRTSPEVPKPHIAIKLDAKLLDVCVGQYKFPSDNVFFIEWKLAIRRQGDQLIGQESTVKNRVFATFEIYPESETNFFFRTRGPQELTFVKHDKGEVTAVIFHRCHGLPDSEGRKLRNE